MRKCAGSCWGQRPDHRQAVNTMSMAAILPTQPHPILRFVDHSRSLPGKQTASSHEPSKCCRQEHFTLHLPEDVFILHVRVNAELWPCRPSPRSSSDYGHGGEREYSVSHRPYISLCRHSIIQVQRESRSEPSLECSINFF